MDSHIPNSQTFPIENYEDWDHTIYKGALAFKETFGAWPNILLGSTPTLHAFDLFMSRKLIAQGKISQVKGMGTFSCSKFELEVCLEEECPDHFFILVFDEEAEFVERDPGPLKHPQEDFKNGRSKI